MSRIVKRALLAAAIVIVPQPAFADECSDILKDGAFDSIFTTSSKDTAQQLNEWLESATYEEIKDKIDVGVVIPIASFPVGVNFTKEKVTEFQNNLKSGKITGFTESTADQFVQKNASQPIVDAWLACMKVPKVGAQIEAHINQAAPEQIVVSARFLPYDETTKPPKITAFTIAGNAKINGYNPFTPGATLPFQPLTVTLIRTRDDGPPARYPGITVTINATNTSDSDTVPAFSLSPTSPTIVTKMFVGPASSPAAHPSARAEVPPGYKLIGGGARVSWNGAGNLLTASYPMPDGRSWEVQSKDHLVSSPATIQAFAIGLYDPKDEWDVRLFQDSSPIRAHPEARVTVPSGYAMTGGGAYSRWAGMGSLLTATYPVSQTVWEARSKDHTKSDPSTLSVYAIGIRPRNGAPAPTVTLVPSQPSLVAAHPKASVALPGGLMLSGGGAFVDWTEPGNLLTAAFPQGNGFAAESKDHGVSGPARITAYAVGISPTTSKTMAYVLPGPAAFLRTVRWVAGTYVSPSTGRTMPLRIRGKLAPAFLAEIRRLGPVTRAGIRWRPRIWIRPRPR